MKLRRTRALLVRIRRRLTYSNVMSTIASFLALGGGAYAVSLPKNTVDAQALAPNSVGSSEIKTNAVGAKDMKLSAVLAKMAGALSTTPVDILGGAGFTAVVTKGYIIHWKSNLLLVGQVSVEDADRVSSTPAEVQVQLFLDGAPVGEPQPHLIPDDFTNTIPISLLLEGVQAGEHMVQIGVAAGGPVTAKVAALTAVAAKA